MNVNTTTGVQSHCQDHFPTRLDTFIALYKNLWDFLPSTKLSILFFREFSAGKFNGCDLKSNTKTHSTDWTTHNQRIFFGSRLNKWKTRELKIIEIFADFASLNVQPALNWKSKPFYTFALSARPTVWIEKHKNNLKSNTKRVTMKNSFYRTWKMVSGLKAREN